MDDVILSGNRYTFEAVKLGGNAKHTILANIVFAETGELYRKHLWVATHKDFMFIGKNRHFRFTAETGQYTKLVVRNGELKSVLSDNLYNLSDIEIMGKR